MYDIRSLLGYGVVSPPFEVKPPTAELLWLNSTGVVVPNRRVFLSPAFLLSGPYCIRVPRYNTENVIRVPRYNTENVIMCCAVQKSPRILGEIWVFWSNIGDLSILVFLTQQQQGICTAEKNSTFRHNTRDHAMAISQKRSAQFFFESENNMKDTLNSFNNAIFGIRSKNDT